MPSPEHPVETGETAAKEHEHSSSVLHEKDWKKDLLKILRSKPLMITVGVLLALVLIRLGVNAWLTRAQVVPPAVVETVQPSFRTLDKNLTLPGNIEPIEEASIYSHVSGYLKKIYVDEGDTVKKGELLATIDAPDVVQAYTKAKADYEFKDVTRKRYGELLKGQVVSEQEYDTVNAAADESKAKLDNAKANVEYTFMHAPFAGSIARRYKYPGDLISAEVNGAKESPIFLLVNESRLRIAVDVPQTDVADVQVGHPVQIKVDAYPGEVFPGAVSRVDALLNESTKTQRVLIDIDNPDHKLRTGMFASVTLRQEHKDNALAIPRDALRRDSENNTVVYVVQKNKVKKVEVQTGLHDANYIEITKGVSSTDKIVLHGEVSNGQKVEVRSAPQKM